MRCLVRSEVRWGQGGVWPSHIGQVRSGRSLFMSQRLKLSRCREVWSGHTGQVRSGRVWSAHTGLARSVIGLVRSQRLGEIREGLNQVTKVSWGQVAAWWGHRGQIISLCRPVRCLVRSFSPSFCSCSFPLIFPSFWSLELPLLTSFYCLEPPLLHSFPSLESPLLHSPSFTLCPEYPKHT